MNPVKILLVDDSKSARYALRLQLQRHGAEVETADSAETALERIKQAAPDAVFMDHTMPGMNGFEALEILKADPTTAHIPVVMCTSNEEPEFMAQARRKGALDIFAKSASPEKLADLMVRLNDAMSQAAAPKSAAPAPAPGEAAPAVAEAAVQAARRETERLLGEQLEQRVQALLQAQLQSVAQRLKAGVLAEVEEKIGFRLEADAQRLRTELTQAQDEQARTAVPRLAGEAVPNLVQEQLQAALPAAVREQLQHEQTGIAQMVQELIDAGIDRLPEDPAFLRRMQQGGSATAASNTQETVRRHAREVAEEAVSGHARAMDKALGAAVARNRTLSIVLAVLAALIGVGAAAGVYFLMGGG